MSRRLRSQRRAPRVPLRVWASLVHRGAEWRVETEDVGPGGCLVRSERLLVPGLDARIVLQRGAISDELAVEGKVAWYDAPRAGIAFDPRMLRSRVPNAWFRKLLAADRRLALAAARLPSELELETPLFLSAPPRILDLRPDEVIVVRCAEQGILVRDLLSRSSLPEQRLGQVVFALLEKRVFTLTVGEAGEAWKWRAALEALGLRQGPDPRSAGPDPEPSPLVSRPPILTPPPILARTPAAAAAPSPTPPAPVVAECQPKPSSPLAQPPVPAPPPPVPHGRYEPRAGARVMARLLRGVGSQGRPPAAEKELGRAREAEAAGRVSEAIRFLRSALAMAPQDREIAAALARLAFLQPAP